MLPQSRPQVGKTPQPVITVFDLFAEIDDLRGQNRALKRRVRELEASRDKWRSESRSWKWGALRWRRSTSA